MYLQALAGHDNLIRLQHVVKAENGRDIYLTFDHMGKKVAGVVGTYCSRILCCNKTDKFVQPRTYFLCNAVILELVNVLTVSP